MLNVGTAILVMCGGCAGGGYQHVEGRGRVKSGPKFPTQLKVGLLSVRACGFGANFYKQAVKTEGGGGSIWTKSGPLGQF